MSEPVQLHTPWTTKGDADTQGRGIIYDTLGNLIIMTGCRGGNRDDKPPAEVIRRVNGYNDLLETLRRLVKAIDDDADFQYGSGVEVVQFAKDVIASIELDAEDTTKGKP